MKTVLPPIFARVELVVNVITLMSILLKTALALNLPVFMENALSPIFAEMENVLYAKVMMIVLWELNAREPPAVFPHAENLKPYVHMILIVHQKINVLMDPATVFARRLMIVVIVKVVKKCQDLFLYVFKDVQKDVTEHLNNAK